jgi:hypothetical protein
MAFDATIFPGNKFLPPGVDAMQWSAETGTLALMKGHWVRWPLPPRHEPEVLDAALAAELAERAEMWEM